MKTRLPEMSRAEPNRLPPASFPVDLCARCRRELLPKRTRPSIAADAHRAAAKHMVDPKAERIRAKRRRKLVRREERLSLRSAVKAIGIVAVARKFILDGRFLEKDPPPSENCPRCLRLRLKRRRIA